VSHCVANCCPHDHNDHNDHNDNHDDNDSDDDKHQRRASQLDNRAYSSTATHITNDESDDWSHASVWLHRL
jgi:hypothetical protein